LTVASRLPEPQPLPATGTHQSAPFYNARKGRTARKSKEMMELALLDMLLRARKALWGILAFG